MEQFLKMARFILEQGQYKDDRTNTGTISYFDYQMRFNLKEGFPILTTKKIHFKSVVYELLWFIKGVILILNILVDHDVRIWNEWPYEKYKLSSEYHKETLAEFVEKIKTNPSFSAKFGDLGPVYGKQWRNFNGVDQLAKSLENLKKNPYSHRHIISAWNTIEVDEMALLPCHTLIQFYVSKDNKLSCQLYQRSADVFLGVPFKYCKLCFINTFNCASCWVRCWGFCPYFGWLSYL